VASSGDLLKRVLIGRAIRTDREHGQLLPKWIALPVFCSDPISSVAYATEQILLVAGLGGAAFLSLASPVALAVVVLLGVVVLSYRPTCYAYPSGGGAFIVSQDNFGEKAALTAAAALLVDYVMTVAVSVVAGVLAITSKFPALQAHAVALSVGFVLLLAVVNLRGLKESGTAFALRRMRSSSWSSPCWGPPCTRAPSVGDCRPRRGPASSWWRPNTPAGI